MTSVTVTSRRSTRKPLSDFALVAAISVIGLLGSLALAMLTWPDSMPGLGF
jgi:hypothetical protein